LPEWPDWTGETVAIVASGPSAKQANPAQLEGRAKVIAIKKSVELVPFADAVYGCDFPWWKSVNGLPAFKGLRLAYHPRACDQYGCAKVEIPKPISDELLFEKTGVVGGGGNSGFQALNLAAQFGASRIILVGIDCQDRSGVHWYGRNGWNGGSNPGENNFRRWRSAFTTAAKQLSDRGVEVVNASPITEVKAFPKRSIAETLEAWGL
jgi:hypothetical protein